MALFNLARHPTRAIRLAVLALLLALGINAFAHASHTHDGDNGSAAQHVAFCGYCSTFAAIAGAPDAPAIADLVRLFLLGATTLLGIAIASRTPTSACPRGPPSP